jgi:hypothetical protein
MVDREIQIHPMLPEDPHMRLCSPISWMTLIAAAAASADFSYPLGKGLESLDLPFADSFVVSGRFEQSYADEEMTGEMALLVFGMMLPDGGYELDTTRQVVIGLPTGYLVTTDSAGLPRQLRSRFEGLGTSTFTTSERRYDAQGRAVMEVGTTSLTSAVEFEFDQDIADTIRWTWRNPGCADDQESDTLRLWSVDAQGRCASSDVRVLSGAGSVSTGLVDKILWQGDVLVGAVRLQGTDTLARSVIAVDGRGNVIEDVSFEKIEGEWVLTARDSFVYVDGKLDLIKMKEYTEGVVSSDLQFKSTRTRTGVVAAHRSGASWIAVARTGSEVSFSNRSTQLVVIDLVDSRGRRLDGIAVAAGSTGVWNNDAKGPVFWRARSSARTTSGIVPGR